MQITIKMQHFFIALNNLLWLKLVNNWEKGQWEEESHKKWFAEHVESKTKIFICRIFVIEEIGDKIFSVQDFNSCLSGVVILDLIFIAYIKSVWKI